MKLFGLAIGALIVSSPIIAHEGIAKPQVIKKVQVEQAVAQKKNIVRHSGGTDSKGCHTNHSTGVYHCHKPK